MMDRIIRFFLEKKIITALLLVLVVVWGVMVAPFDWKIGSLPRDPVPVDAIPDIGENQQIVFTPWKGRSPQDVEDQISYPLTVSLLGIPGIKTVRSYSMLGFSTVYVIFEEEVEFYWSRSRILEKLSSLPSGTLPPGVSPSLGPDATALGQVFWYTLEGLDENGDPTGGWDLDELRSIQDWYVRYALLSASGVSEVASVGGYVREYQIDVDPDAMRAYGVSLGQVFGAVKMSNKDVGARTIEINRVEYVIRGKGFITDVADIENAVIKVNGDVPVYVKNVAKVAEGPALRRGALDKEGAEAVGGVVVVRYGDNPLATIGNIKEKIAEISAGLPAKIMPDGRKSQVSIVPFYDRSGLIHETLETLNAALSEEILITILVVLVMVMHLRSALMISVMVPLSVLICFIAMKLVGVDANIVALSGIAIAIGTIVDVGIVICENILTRLEKLKPGENSLEAVHSAASEMGGAVLTAVATTVVSFLPVFTMEAAEGKLFKPLAFTKTFTLLGSIIVALTVLPPLAHLLLAKRGKASEGDDFADKKRSGTGTDSPAERATAGGDDKLVEGPGSGTGDNSVERSETGRVAKPAGMYSFGRLFAALREKGPGRVLLFFGLMIGAGFGFTVKWWLGLLIGLLALRHLAEPHIPQRWKEKISRVSIGIVALVVALKLTGHWMPLGPEKGLSLNLLFVSLLIGGTLGIFLVFHSSYERILRWCLANKAAFLSLPMGIVLLGGMIWLGADALLGWVPEKIRKTTPLAYLSEAFPGLGKEFMPPLDEGSFLYMPTTMAHASIGEVQDVLRIQDKAIRSIPEVETVVGKLGRAETPLDPAPVSMIETVINYRSKFLLDEKGKRRLFKWDGGGRDLFRDVAGDPVNAPDGKPYKVHGKFVRDEGGLLVEDPDGSPFRLWRPALSVPLNPGRTAWEGINANDDIWNEIVDAAQVPGTTSAPRLQPIAARIVMLQSGMRAPMGIKVKGPSLEAIEMVGLAMEQLLKEVPKVEPAAVIADRIVGKPYLEINIHREKVARYGIRVQDVQDVIEVAVGGRTITTTVEGRERYPVRVRYQRELRDSIEALDRILVPAPDGKQIPMGQLATVTYVRGPQMIKSEDTFLVGYVLFDKKSDAAEVDTVEQAAAYLAAKVKSGELKLPAGVSYTFAGNYENQIRSEKRLMIVLPLALFVIFMILYLQFGSAVTTAMIFSGILVAWAGGFIMIWAYSIPGFMDFNFLGANMRELFQMHPVNMSVAIWVGFLALFGIATDDGVIMTTYLEQVFGKEKPDSVARVREMTVMAGKRRVRPCLMTTATTVLALIPVLTSTGRGSDIMVPMAIPSFGGMVIAMITMFVIPVLYCALAEIKLNS